MQMMCLMCFDVSNHSSQTPSLTPPCHSSYHHQHAQALRQIADAVPPGSGRTVLLFKSEKDWDSVPVGICGDERPPLERARVALRVRVFPWFCLCVFFCVCFY